MTNVDAAAYAASKQEVKPAEPAAKPVKGLTVAEYRNKFNPITKYYDNWDALDFLCSTEVPAKTKIEVMLGKRIASFVDEDTLEEINAKLKGE